MFGTVRFMPVALSITDGAPVYDPKPSTLNPKHKKP